MSEVILICNEYVKEGKNRCRIKQTSMKTIRQHVYRFLNQIIFMYIKETLG